MYPWIVDLLAFGTLYEYVCVLGGPLPDPNPSTRTLLPSNCCQFHGDNYLILIGRAITSASSHPHTSLILTITPTNQRLLHLERLNSGDVRFVFVRIFEPYCLVVNFAGHKAATRDLGI